MREYIDYFIEAIRLHNAPSLDALQIVDIENFRQEVRVTWNTFAVLSVWLSQREGVMSDRDRAGYVIWSIGEVKVYVPFFLLPLVPSNDVLSELIALANAIRTDVRSVISLSGSACHAGKIRQIGDLDFCEYIPPVNEGHVRRLLDLGGDMLGGDGATKLLHLEVGADNIYDLSTSSEKEVLDLLKAARKCQCVFVGRLEEFGVLEVTNLLLETNYIRPLASANADESFSFQEIAFSPSSWVPWDLSDPADIARYLKFLLNSVNDYCSSSHERPRHLVKAARRLFSACRFMMLEHHCEVINSLLQDNGVILATLQDRCKLFGIISQRKELSMDRIKFELKSSIDALRRILAGPYRIERRGPYGKLSEDEGIAFEAFDINARSAIESIAQQVRIQIGLH